MALRKFSIRISVFLTSDEYTSDPTIGQKGTCNQFFPKEINNNYHRDNNNKLQDMPQRMLRYRYVSGHNIHGTFKKSTNVHIAPLWHMSLEIILMFPKLQEICFLEE